MKNKRETLINIFAALITLGVQMFISFWLSPFVVGKLGEEAYGFINLANNFISYASLVSVAINSMASRYISVEYNSGNKEKAKFIFLLCLYCKLLFVWANIDCFDFICLEIGIYCEYHNSIGVSS